MSALLFNRYENVLNTLPGHTPEFRAALARCAQTTRESWHSDDQHQQTIWNTASNVIGPLYTEFVWWLLYKAKKAGVKRLYFMARDGLILKDIADLLITTGHFQFDTRYLYVSRQSLLYASVNEIDAFDIRWMMWNPLTPLSVKTILKRMELVVDHVTPELAELGIKDFDRPLSLPEKKKFQQLFLRPTIKRMVLESAEKKHETTVAYLKQEGLTDGTPFALVDIGWIALSQYAISRMLDKEKQRPAAGVKGYYLGTNWLLWKYKNDSAESFLYNPENMLWRMPLVQYELPEIFATADHGRTLRYEKDGDKILPVLGDPPATAKAWGSDIQRKGTVAFTQSFLDATLQNSWRDETPTEKIGKIFNLFCNWPSREEADTYGKFTHGADMEEKEGKEIAPVIGFADLFKILTGYYWVQGSMRRSKLLSKVLLIYLFTLINTMRHVVLHNFDRLFSKRK